jgi:dTDP-4-amino-4,6-dideoxygalactose transaminase
MWARTQLKIGWGDLLAGAVACALPGSREREAARLESYWNGGDTVAAYSVRSGFDLLLQSLGLEPGDEVIFSALNVRGMIKIVSRLGYVPIPVDLDVAHFAPRMDKLEQAISNRSRVLVIAHLFGTRLDLDPMVAFARKHNLLLVEDCAQVFDGKGYEGHRDADVRMFSFGPLKTSTALGGALIRVRDPELRERMRRLQATYPVQTTAKQLKRVAQFAALKVVTSRFVMQRIYSFFHARGQDYEDAVSERVRNVAPLGSSRKLRYQPSLAMLRLMARRIFGYREGSLAETAAIGRRLRDLIGDSVVLPAQANPVHNYWVFPMLVDQPQAFIEGLRDKGFDCADLPRSQAVSPPEDRPQLEPKLAAQALSDMVVVPCYPGMPDSEIRREAEAIREIAGRVGSARTRAYSAQPMPAAVDAA